MIPLTVAVRSWQNSPTSQRPSTSQAPKDRSSWLGREARSAVRMAMASEGGRPSKKNCRSITNMAMDQYLYIPFLGGWTSIYQLFWCSPGVQGFDPLPYLSHLFSYGLMVGLNVWKSSNWCDHATTQDQKVMVLQLHCPGPLHSWSNNKLSLSKETHHFPHKNCHCLVMA